MADKYSSDLKDGGTVIIVSHFDDEILWFPQELLQNAKAVIVTHGLSETGRHLAVNTHESGNFLNGHMLPVYSAFPVWNDHDYLARSSDNERCPTDLQITNKENITRQLIPLLEQLKQDGATRIITHNAWGEYGHPDHKTTEAAVRQAGQELGMDVWENTVARTGGTAPREQGGAYLNASYLDAKHSEPYDYSKDEAGFYAMRAQFQSTVLVNNEGNDARRMWTWHDGPTEYPVTYIAPRTFIRTVSVDVNGIAKDHLEGLDSSDHQKIVGCLENCDSKLAEQVRQLQEWQSYNYDEPIVGGTTPRHKFVVRDYYACDPADPSKPPEYNPVNRPFVKTDTDPFHGR